MVWPAATLPGPSAANGDGALARCTPGPQTIPHGSLLPWEKEDAARVLREFRGDLADLDLPSAPPRPILVRTEEDRPQPRRDRDEGDGMIVVVGRVRPCPVLTLRYELLSHNTVRGAAGAAILNGELLAARQLLPRRTSG